MTPESLLEIVSRETRVPVAHIVGAGRTGGVSYARCLAYYCFRELLPHMGSAEVSALLGGRDRTAVSHGVKRAEQYMREDVRFVETVEKITRLWDSTR